MPSFVSVHELNDEAFERPLRDCLREVVSEVPQVSSDTHASTKLLKGHRRGRVICVVQIVALIVAVAPIIPPPLSAAAAAAGLLVLACSFLVDTIRLWRNARST